MGILPPGQGPLPFPPAPPGVIVVVIPIPARANPLPSQRPGNVPAAPPGNGQGILQEGQQQGQAVAVPAKRTRSNTRRTVPLTRVATTEMASSPSSSASATPLVHYVTPDAAMAGDSKEEPDLDDTVQSTPLGLQRTMNLEERARLHSASSSQASRDSFALKDAIERDIVEHETKLAALRAELAHAETSAERLDEVASAAIHQADLLASPVAYLWELQLAADAMPTPSFDHQQNADAAASSSPSTSSVCSQAPTSSSSASTSTFMSASSPSRSPLRPPSGSSSTSAPSSSSSPTRPDASASQMAPPPTKRRRSGQPTSTIGPRPLTQQSREERIAVMAASYTAKFNGDGRGAPP